VKSSHAEKTPNSRHGTTRGRRGNRPLYRKVEEDLLEAIRARRYREGERIPSEYELARRYSVSRITINKALSNLVAKGLLVRERGYGTFVKRRKPQLWHRLAVKVNVCHFDEEFHTPLVQAFEHEHPGVIVDVNRSMDDPNDIVKIQTSHMIEAERHFLPLDRFPGWEETLAGALPDVLSIFTKDGHPYAVPRRADVLVVFFNVDMFEAEGIPIPDETLSWDDLRDLSEKLARPKDGLYGLALVHETKYALPIVWQSGGDFFNSDLTRCTIDDERVVAAIERYNSLDRSGLSDGKPMRNNDAIRAFITGRAAMIMSAGWMHLFLNEHGGFRWAVRPLPREGRPMTLLQADGYAISRNCAEPDLAWELIRLLSGREQQEHLARRGLPLVAFSDAKQLNEYGRLVLRELANARGSYEFWRRDVMQRLKEREPALWQPDADVRAWCKATAHDINALLCPPHPGITLRGTYD